MTALRALIAKLIDYAGLFPPAGLSMADAVGNYARYRASGVSWALGRFILPIARLEEFASEQARVEHDTPWSLSVLGTDRLDADLRVIDRFLQIHDGRAVIESIETKVSESWLDANDAARVPDSLEIYCEVDAVSGSNKVLSRIASKGWNAKIRTGGVTVEAFPDESTILRFMASCAQLRLPFKATAGLHHPLRCTRPLTYEKDAPEGAMHGFLNVFFAATLIRSGVEITRLGGILEERDPANLRVETDRIVWRDLEATDGEIAATRSSFAKSFGSCSFEEPIDDLRALGWLQ